jgi:ABC-2 type transport system ATP-binding protein
MSVIAVDIRGLTHRYHRDAEYAVREVTVRIEQGAFFALLGPNGGGKTTLFRVLSTLLRPSSGTAEVFGRDVTADAPGVRRRLGIVFQQTALDDELTVAENLRTHGALYGLSGRVLEERMTYLLDVFGLSDRATARVSTLSGGLQRRADLARGLLHSPDLLLLDEPTTGLDPVARRGFWQALSRLRRAEGTTVLLATHLLEEAEECDVVAIIDRGSIVVTGSPAGLKGALGGETLWLEAPEATRSLADKIAARFDVSVTLAGTMLQISHPEPHTLLPMLYNEFGSRIVSATIRRPTLDDVFILHAGHRIDVPAELLPH